MTADIAPLDASTTGDSSASGRSASVGKDVGTLTVPNMKNANETPPQACLKKAEETKAPVAGLDTQTSPTETTAAAGEPSLKGANKEAASKESPPPEGDRTKAKP
ncbi:hypothetical protein NDU88_004392 [Pleurodeles waltl]|uniref:Uncharacterized protein n=1 Tax=Pleurodeles waltl TaxID=8319 RepID=A0AAV7KYA1_PLEWA|nr:hypothetical protein NDU88_004392 [Pleurodeles waltl]